MVNDLVDGLSVLFYYRATFVLKGHLHLNVFVGYHGGAIMYVGVYNHLVEHIAVMVAGDLEEL